MIQSKVFNDWVPLEYKGKKAGDLKIEVSFFPEGVPAMPGMPGMPGMPAAYPPAAYAPQPAYPPAAYPPQPAYPAAPAYAQPGYVDPAYAAYPAQPAYPPQPAPGYPPQPAYPPAPQYPPAQYPRILLFLYLPLIYIYSWNLSRILEEKVRRFTRQYLLI